MPHGLEAESLHSIIQQAPLAPLLHVAVAFMGRNEEASVRQIVSSLLANMGEEDISDFLEDLKTAIDPTGIEEAADSKLAKARSEKTLSDSKPKAPKAFNKAQRQFGKKLAKDHK